jgi:hypothetical protein
MLLDKEFLEAVAENGKLRVRIAELEKFKSEAIKEVAYWSAQAGEWAAKCGERDARIAELEAALSRLLNALNAGIIHPPEEYGEAKCQARAVLLETKYD